VIGGAGSAWIRDTILGGLGHYRATVPDSLAARALADLRVTIEAVEEALHEST
jgi:hypothetical protein